jgi:hypothetical protein
MKRICPREIPITYDAEEGLPQPPHPSKITPQALVRSPSGSTSDPTFEGLLGV